MERMKQMMKKLAARSTEIVLTILLVLICFLAIVRLITVFFPAGTSLRDLLAEGSRRGAGPDGALVIPGEPGARGTVPFVATLSRVHRSVKDKPSDAIAWTGAHTGLTLRDRHAVQTFDRSEATIRFDAGEELQVGENSLVVVKRLRMDVEGGRRQASVIVLGGELTGRTGPSGSALDLEILTAQGTSRVTSGGGRSGATFSLRVNDDDTSTLSVFEGKAQVTSGGRTLTVGQDEGIVISRRGPLGGPGRLPRPPRMEAPADLATIYQGHQAPPVDFQWAGDPELDAYRIVIASDPDLHDVVLNMKVTDTTFTHGNLHPGNYYWRVAGLRGGLSSRQVPVRHLNVVQDLEPPPLTVGFPEGMVETGSLVVTGFTEPGSRVIVSSHETRAGETGAFEQSIPLKRGPNLVVVESHDAAGNTAYRTRIINARY